jgi:hypothetical protein
VPSLACTRHAKIKIAPETGPRFPRAGEGYCVHSKRPTTPVAVAPGRLPNSGRRTPIDRLNSPTPPVIGQRPGLISCMCACNIHSGER